MTRLKKQQRILYTPAKSSNHNQMLKREKALLLLSNKIFGYKDK